MDSMNWEYMLVLAYKVVTLRSGLRERPHWNPPVVALNVRVFTRGAEAATVHSRRFSCAGVMLPICVVPTASNIPSTSPLLQGSDEMLRCEFPDVEIDRGQLTCRDREYNPSMSKSLSVVRPLPSGGVL